ncbi:hypothetical protein NDU88_001762, partial [Pleurodeles waltl]
AKCMGSAEAPPFSLSLAGEPKEWLAEQGFFIRRAELLAVPTGSLTMAD